ncbi:hypothetical protein HRED_10167 [Candidatus Haloredivivus sp. G17]|nr:hypothetical protein HRED_10167 [Candidatus Haloredivivus sp. G17]
MFPYERGLNAESVFKKKVVENTLGEEIAEKGFTQLRVAESQKKNLTSPISSTGSEN